MSRSIEKEMVLFLDDKLEKNGMAKLAIETGNARALMFCAAQACVGIREVGHNKGKFVELIQKTIGGAEQEPWCMAAVQTWIAYAELKTGKRSPIIASEHCMTVWRETPSAQRVKTRPLQGAVIIWNHEGSDSGHTGVVFDIKSVNSFVSIEGNTGPSGGREGDGVYVKERGFIRNGNLKVMGFLKPF